MHHTNMVRGVVEGVKEVLKQEQALIETPITVLEPHEHVENAVHITQQQLAAQLQKMWTMIQEMQLQYSAAP